MYKNIYSQLRGIHYLLIHNREGILINFNLVNKFKKVHMSVQPLEKWQYIHWHHLMLMYFSGQ